MLNIYVTSKVLIRVELLYVMPTYRGKFKIASETYNTVTKQAVILDFQVFRNFPICDFC